MVTMARCRAAISMHEFLIQRLDEAHVDERGVEPLGDLAGRFDQRAERENGKSAAAFAAVLCAPDGQRGHLGDQRHARARCRADSAPPTGADSVVAVYSIWRHSFSSAGAMITMFGMQRRKVRS